MGIMLASSGFLGGGGFYGGEIGNLLAQWEQVGVFSYVLPFLLLFALIFGILTRSQIFKENRAINAVLSLAVSLLALQFDFVPIFFSEIFPRAGVALAVILVFLILAGLFLDPESKVANYGLLILGVIVFLVVLVQTAGWLGWYSGYWWYDNWPKIVGVVVFIAVLMAIINSGKDNSGKGLDPYYGWWARPGAAVPPPPKKMKN